MDSVLTKPGTIHLVEKIKNKLAPIQKLLYLQSKIYFNEKTQRYEGIGEWLNSRRDGLIYGVKIPKYSFSTTTTATKIGANANLILEPSTETSAGRNDYENIVLFECIRCNGGVDADGMPYVTAIEGLDGRFDPIKNNTYIITPVYYRKITSDTQYSTFEYTDTPTTGFTACYGAYTATNVLRPFILRACYLDSDGKCSSKSGTIPGTYRSPTSIAHSLNYDLTNSKNRQDGLTFLTYGDICYQEDFMELMLGVKAPRSQVVGCCSYNYQYNLAAAETNVKRIILTDAQAAFFEIGSTVSVGNETVTNKDRNNIASHAIASSVKIISKTSLGNGNTALNLNLSSNITTKTNYFVSSMPWYNGTCDKIQGTYGARTTAALKNSKEPFRFQNCEWNLGVWEVFCNYMGICSTDGTNDTYEYYLAPDISKVTTSDGQTGWVKMTHITVDTKNAKYIKDYEVEKGARIPSAWSGTATTGYMSGCWLFGSAGSHEILAGGDLRAGALAGVGAFDADYATGSAYWSFGGRSSTIGHSAPAE